MNLETFKRWGLFIRLEIPKTVECVASSQTGAWKPILGSFDILVSESRLHSRAVRSPTKSGIDCKIKFRLMHCRVHCGELDLI